MKYKKLALVAGGGSLPLVFLKKAAQNGVRVLVIEIEGEGSHALSGLCYRKVSIKPAHLSDMIKAVKDESISHVMFLGYVRPSSLFKDILFDERTRKALISLGDKRPKALMRSAIAEFKKDSIETIPSTYLMEDVMAGAGYLTRVRPDLKDISFGVGITRKLSGLDVGQTTVVGSGMIWAVEAMEGTDGCIKRGGSLSRGNFFVVKMARPGQDLRYDVPAIGLRTLKLIKSLGGSGIVVEAGRTFLLDREELIKYADKNKLFIYGWRKK